MKLFFFLFLSWSYRIEHYNFLSMVLEERNVSSAVIFRYLFYIWLQCLFLLSKSHYIVGTSIIQFPFWSILLDHEWKWHNKITNNNIDNNEGNKMQPFYVFRSSNKVIVWFFFQAANFNDWEKIINCMLCFHTQLEVFFQTKFHPGMKFCSRYPWNKFTCKQVFFHPRAKLHLGYI